MHPNTAKVNKLVLGSNVDSCILGNSGSRGRLGTLVAMQRCFRYVHWLPAKKLWVVHRRGCARTGRCYKTQKEAAKDAARLFGTNITSLALQQPSTPAPRRFRFVYWDCVRQQWQVKRKGYRQGLYAPTQYEAAKLAAKEFKVSVLLLTLRQPADKKRKRQNKRQYRFVYFDTRDKQWRVRRKGIPCKGGFPTELAAAKFAAKSVGETLSTLRVGTRRCVDMHTQVKRFRDLWSIYRSTSTDHPFMPGDVQDLLRRSTALRQLTMFPGLIIPFLLAKFGPHRDILMEVASARQHNYTAHPQDTVAQAKWLCNVLRIAVTKISKTKLPAAWIKNVGRNNCHHSGLVQLVRGSLGMLRGSSRLNDKLKSLVVFGEQLLRTQPTTSLAQWVSAAHSLQEGIAKLRVAGFRTARCYRALWTIRLWLFWRMRHAKYPRLRLDKNCTVLEFMTAFPDQRHWGQRFARSICSSKAATIDALFQAVRYDGPPELFSMFTCLFGDKQLNSALTAKSPTWLSQQHGALTQALLNYRDEHGIVPHPAVLVLAAARD